MKTPAEILAEHHISVGNEGGWYCSSFECGSYAHFHEATLHQADALAAAGYGLLMEAQAEAWADGVQTVASINALPEVETARMLADNPYRTVKTDAAETTRSGAS